jgi:hypothetical protein
MMAAVKNPFDVYLRVVEAVAADSNVDAFFKRKWVFLSSTRRRNASRRWGWHTNTAGSEVGSATAPTDRQARRPALRNRFEEGVSYVTAV